MEEEIQITEQHQISNQRITKQELILEKKNFSSHPIKTAALNNYLYLFFLIILQAKNQIRFFIVWENGILQLWDLKTAQLIKQGNLPNTQMIQDLPKKDDFGVIGNYRIAFHDTRAFAIKVFDVEKEIIIDEHSTAPFPTFTAVPEIQRNDLTKLKNQEFQFLCMPESGSIVTIETKDSMNPSLSDSIITVFKEENFPNFFAQTIYRTVKGSKIIQINNTNKIVIFQQIAQGSEHQFFYWNIEKENGFGVYTIKTQQNKLDSTIIDAKEIEPNTI